MKANFRHTCSIIAIASIAAALARAGETPIDISALANEPWSFVGPAQITGGTSYPQEARISAAFHSRFRLVRRIIGMPAPQQTSDRAPSASPIQVWTDGEGQRLDRQEYILPGAFASQVALRCLCCREQRNFQQQDLLRPALGAVLPGRRFEQHRRSGREGSLVLYLGRPPVCTQPRERIGCHGVLHADWQPVRCRACQGILAGPQILRRSSGWVSATPPRLRFHSYTPLVAGSLGGTP